MAVATVPVRLVGLSLAAVELGHSYHLLQHGLAGLPSRGSDGMARQFNLEELRRATRSVVSFQEMSAESAEAEGEAEVEGEKKDADSIGSRVLRNVSSPARLDFMWSRLHSRKWRHALGCNRMEYFPLLSEGKGDSLVAPLSGRSLLGQR